jgi:signal transduction histidine kinase
VLPPQIHQLFVNLLMNAIKYSTPGIPPKIYISSEVVDAKHIKKSLSLSGTSYWKITFADNGIGFGRQYEEKIFELFQRLHGKNEFEGTGIGLAICRKIIQNHNGHIYAEGRPEEGATFFICLPLTI